MDPFSLDIAAAFSPAIPITFMACKEAQNASDETARNSPIGALIMSKVLAVHCFCIILLIKEWTKNLPVSLYLQAEGKWCSKNLDVHPPFCL